ncbi:antizyme inhibitor 2-like [Mercenaria mercenaria]|uniref:antizyme inhibitor 2-like n=1 Tax=Mercenaria mercenaria TaxID=6596 RepID=UPI00234E4A5C|nr:antizyme inhibitor 2-like [Mercenaria mercenaria]
MKKYIVDDIPVDLHSERKSRHELLQEYVTDSKREGKDEHFFVCDTGDIIEKYQQWVRLLPSVKLFYAMKCNPDKAVLQILADLGASFDCASKNEIETVLGLGVNPDRVIYTHTQKRVTSLIYAERNNVSLMTFDSEMELHKIKSHHPKARLLLRILLHEKFEGRETFGNKFGCPSFQIRDLLQLAKELELNIVGISFHVGSGITDPGAYASALKQSRKAFEMARETGFNPNILDIGGGFPGEHNTSDFFQKITEILKETLDDLFPPEECVDIIAEPGRYMVASAYTIVDNITGKRLFPTKSLERENGNEPEKDTNEAAGNTFMYYLNDSVFGNFLVGKMFNPMNIPHVPKLFKAGEDVVSHESVLWGFTCNSVDCINASVRMPELDIGDWLYFEDMGAYTKSLSSNFNGLETPEIKYHCLETSWLQVYPDTHKGKE